MTTIIHHDVSINHISRSELQVYCSCEELNVTCRTLEGAKEAAWKHVAQLYAQEVIPPDPLKDIKGYRIVKQRDYKPLVDPLTKDLEKSEEKG